MAASWTVSRKDRPPLHPALGALAVLLPHLVSVARFVTSGRQRGLWRRQYGDQSGLSSCNREYRRRRSTLFAPGPDERLGSSRGAEPAKTAHAAAALSRAG